MAGSLLRIFRSSFLPIINGGQTCCEVNFFFFCETWFKQQKKLIKYFTAIGRTITKNIR